MIKINQVLLALLKNCFIKLHRQMVSRTLTVNNKRSYLKTNYICSTTGFDLTHVITSIREGVKKYKKQ